MLIYIKIPSSLPTFSKLVFIKHSYVHFQDAERGVSNFSSGKNFRVQLQ